MQQLSRLIYARTGMTFGEAKRYYIERRFAVRMARSGAPNAATYLAKLPLDGAEMQALINAFTINETYFYREDVQIAALARDMLPELVADRTPGSLVRIWSMPCSTGEEPYSIAIWLLENWPMVDAWHIEIVGSDIDSAAIDQARRGIYGERALQRLPTDVRERYFLPERNLEREIIDDLKESVQFGVANLIETRSSRAQGKFDVIFCRNLLIYFDDDARQLAAAHLYDCLNPGGFLCLGHTESMNRISDRFELVRFGDAMVYRRR
ncbi:protein-glutamate O-methyltransferase CheR [Sphingomonas nostoxanthinifaciens]|nr:protein-glutamate O-methyltransferase CheR [Sphingomonas nostoxanthinifaciens]